MATLAKRFPRFDEDERLSIYHDAWARLLAKGKRGEEVENVRAYLLATCTAEALHVVSRNRRPIPVDPGELLFANLPDGSTPVDEQVVLDDQARLARSLIDTLDERQRMVLKLRWDLQLDGTEIRAALGLSRRQYQRLSEESTAAIADRVEEMDDGTWSRRQRSLLVACLVEVGEGEGRRRGIATARQREEAQRLLESDPHFAALFREVRRAMRRAAVILPLPLIATPDRAWAASRTAETLASTRERFGDLLDAGRQHATSAYVRAADPTLLSSPRPGTAVAAVAGCLAVGGGAFGAYDAASSARPVEPQVAAKTVPATPAPPPTLKPVTRAPSPASKQPRASKHSDTTTPTTAPEPIPNDDPLPPPPSPTSAPAPSTTSEFGFEN